MKNITRKVHEFERNDALTNRLLDIFRKIPRQTRRKIAAIMKGKARISLQNLSK